MQEESFSQQLCGATSVRTPEIKEIIYPGELLVLTQRCFNFSEAFETMGTTRLSECKELGTSTLLRAVGRDIFGGLKLNPLDLS